MKIDVGDMVALKIDGPIRCPNHIGGIHRGGLCPPKGKPVQVARIAPAVFVSGLRCGCINAHLSDGSVAVAQRLRKIKKADDEFTEYMRRMKPANKRVDA